MEGQKKLKADERKASLYWSDCHISVQYPAADLPVLGQTSLFLRLALPLGLTSTSAQGRKQFQRLEMLDAKSISSSDSSRDPERRRKIKDSHHGTWHSRDVSTFSSGGTTPSLPHLTLVSLALPMGSAHRGHEFEGLCPLGIFGLDSGGSVGHAGELYRRLQSQIELAKIL